MGISKRYRFNAGMLIVLCLFFILLTGVSCNSPYTPRKRGYFKIELPQKKYVLFDKPGYPYTFEYPVYANVEKDSTYFGEETENPWWINLNFPRFDATIYISYKDIRTTKFDKLLSDAFELTGKHVIKASEKNDSLIHTPNHVEGMFFTIGGDVATANQFFLTDSTQHFLRGALYFNATPNQDSLQPVNDFLVQDVRHLINTFKWK